MRRTSGFLAMVSDFLKSFFHSKVTDRASHPFPLGFKRILGINSPNWKTKAENCWQWERHKLLVLVVEGVPGSSLGPVWQ